MKKKIYNKAQRLLALFFALVLVISSIQLPSAAAEKKEGKNGNLVNIAADCDISVASEQYPKGNMVDGDDETLWVQNGGQWPSEVSLRLPMDNTKKVKKVVVKFEKGHPNWSVDVKLSHALNNVTSDLVVDDVKEGHPFDETYEYVYDTALNFTHTYITLSNPTDNGQVGGFWPAIAEVEIWAEEETGESDLLNVASSANITSVGGDAGVKGNLVDENYDTLYVFNNGGMSTLPDGAWIEMELDREYPVQSMEAAFELLDPDSNDFHFTFDVLGKSSADTQWQTLFAGVEATRLKDGHIQELKLDAAKNLKSVRINITDIKSSGGDPWPALAEFKIFADAGAGDVEDTESIAYKKPVHTNAGQSTVSRINDGSTVNVWSGERYPAYIDIDLEKNYNLDEIQVFTPSAGYSQYSIYTSMDGRDFDKLAEKTSKDSCPKEGESYQAKGKEARIVRLYIEYQSESSKSLVNEVRVLGKESKTPVMETPEVVVEDFEGSAYDVDITNEDTIEEVQGIVERQIGAEYVDWFTFELADADNGYDYFDISQNGDKIHIKGNDGVSLATGLNHYLKYFCNVNISQVGDQVKMPKEIVPVQGTIHKETKFPVRYSYNYCTLSYSMAFWGEEEWRNELDWLALNGVNVVLDATAQEEVWRRFLGELGYTHEEAKDFIAGPAYYAWAYMANLSGFGGPVHDNWFVERTDLARKNQLAMRKLGMQPALQGYSGMVPVDITDKDPSAQVIKQGTWCSFQRPSMLKTDSETFDKYAQIFYKVQKQVFGDVSDYYATDPFHEGGNTGGMNPTVISERVLANMMQADKDAVWIIQSWQGNPTTALLQGLEGNREHALVLDLYAEKTPHWNEQDPNAYGGGEFMDTPWVYCMLNNFGGRLGLHGHIQNFVDGVVEAADQAEHMQGIGITPEASGNNPVLYDLFFETIWTDDADNLQKIDLDEWFKDYTTRRYGAESESAYEAMQILNDTVYNPQLNMKGQGAPESVVNARPKLDVSAASTWGNAVIDYDKEDLEEAARLLLSDYDQLKGSAGYQYDLANVLEQVLSNTAQEYQKKMASAFREGDGEKFEQMSDTFLEIISKVEEVTGTQEEFMVGTWIESAKELAKNSDDFTKDLYELNARSLITTWGSIEQANSGGLSDYSNRQWAGLTKDYYQPRWEKWIAERKKELAGEESKEFSLEDWFEMEWEWARANNEYPTKPNGLDLEKLGNEILEKYSVTAIPKDPAEDDTYDIPVEGITATAGSEQAVSGSEGPASNVLDGNTSTIWHSVWSGTERENLWIDLKLQEKQMVDGVRVLPRQEGGTNGIITKYRIEVSTDGENYTKVSEGTWNSGNGWKMAKFSPVEATNIRIYAVESLTTDSNNYASAAEIRVMAPKQETQKISTEILEYAIELAEKAGTQDVIPVITEEFEARLAAANTILDKVNSGDTKVTQEQVDDTWKALINIMQYLEFKQGDKTDLEKAIEFAESLDMNDYEDNEKMDAFLEALDAAKDVRDDENAMQDEIDDAWKALIKATAELNRKMADMTDLNKVIEWTSALDLSKYLEEGQDTFRAALEAARDVSGDILSTQKEVDDAWKALMDAASALRLKPDKGALEELLETAKSYLAKEGEYAAEAFAAFRNAYADAAAVLGNEQASAEQVRTAQKNLGDAIVKLDRSTVSADQTAEAVANSAESKTNDLTEQSDAAKKDTVKSAKTGDETAIFMLFLAMAGAALIAGAKLRKKN